jgi:hypothetical protein
LGIESCEEIDNVRCHYMPHFFEEEGAETHLEDLWVDIGGILYMK